MTQQEALQKISDLGQELLKLRTEQRTLLRKLDPNLKNETPTWEDDLRKLLESQPKKNLMKLWEDALSHNFLPRHCLNERKKAYYNSMKMAASLFHIIETSHDRHTVSFNASSKASDYGQHDVLPNSTTTPMDWVVTALLSQEVTCKDIVTQRLRGKPYLSYNSESNEKLQFLLPKLPGKIKIATHDQEYRTAIEELLMKTLRKRISINPPKFSDIGIAENIIKDGTNEKKTYAATWNICTNWQVTFTPRTKAFLRIGTLELLLSMYPNDTSIQAELKNLTFVNSAEHSRSINPNVLKLNSWPPPTPWSDGIPYQDAIVLFHYFFKITQFKSLGNNITPSDALKRLRLILLTERNDNTPSFTPEAIYVLMFSSKWDTLIRDKEVDNPTDDMEIDVAGEAVDESLSDNESEYDPFATTPTASSKPETNSDAQNDNNNQVAGEAIVESSDEASTIAYYNKLNDEIGYYLDSNTDSKSAYSDPNTLQDETLRKDTPRSESDPSFSERKKQQLSKQYKDLYSLSLANENVNQELSEQKKQLINQLLKRYNDLDNLSLFLADLNPQHKISLPTLDLSAHENDMQEQLSIVNKELHKQVEYLKENYTPQHASSSETSHPWRLLQLKRKLQRQHTKLGERLKSPKTKRDA